MRERSILLLLLAGIPGAAAVDSSLLEQESLRLREAGGVAGVHGGAETGVDPGEVPAGRTTSATAPELPSGERIRARERLLEEVENAWSRPRLFGRGEDADPASEEGELLARLESVFIPKVEFREIPLSEVVDILSDLASRESLQEPLNIVLIDPQGMNPRVSIILRRLSLRRVLDFVAESVGYVYDAREDAVVIRPRQGSGFGLETDFYPVSRSTLIRLTGIGDTEKAPLAGLLPDPFAPEDAPATSGRGDSERALKAFLQRAGIGFDGVEGADLALADGQLIVTQTPRNHAKLRQLLRRYREVRQVEIEARFIEVEERNLRELGLDWTLVSSSGQAALQTSGRGLSETFTVGQQERQIVIDREGLDLPRIGQGAPVLPITVDLAEEAVPLVGFSGSWNRVDVDLVLRALERQSGNDLLSAPKLTVLSGKTAEIVVAEEFRYPEAYGDTSAEVGRGDSNSGSAGVAITAGTPRSFTTRNVGVEMQVTPNVEEDNSISLRLKPKVTEFEGFVEYGGTSVAIASDTTVTVPSGFFQPVFSVRRLDTEVTIWDGATVVMGGLTREHAVRVDDRVPVLGDLPLLGRLFRSEGESTQKRNLLIFVTANLVSPGGSPAFQYLPGVEPNSLFQSPAATTPGGLRPRAP